MLRGIMDMGVGVGGGGVGGFRSHALTHQVHQPPVGRAGRYQRVESTEVRYFYDTHDILNLPYLGKRLQDGLFTPDTADPDPDRLLINSINQRNI